jgi:oxaloacetate decarboxylase alpha subunit
LKQAGYETGLDEDYTKEVNDYFKPIKEKYIESGQMDPFVMGVETDALVYQVPGGMLSNLIAQLKAQNAMDRLDEVLEEIPNVRKDLGYPPLVTPMSQMVGVQAVLNVLLGRYKNVGKEVKAYFKGEYGKAPGEINKELMAEVLGDEEPITGRFADTLEPQFEKTKEELKDVARSDEDVLSYIAFPQIAEKFFKEREERENVTVSYSIVKK